MSQRIAFELKDTHLEIMANDENELAKCHLKSAIENFKKAGNCQKSRNLELGIIKEMVRSLKLRETDLSDLDLKSDEKSQFIEILQYKINAIKLSNKASYTFEPAWLKEMAINFIRDTEVLERYSHAIADLQATAQFKTYLSSRVKREPSHHPEYYDALPKSQRVHYSSEHITPDSFLTLFHLRKSQDEKKISDQQNFHKAVSIGFRQKAKL